MSQRARPCRASPANATRLVGRPTDGNGAFRAMPYLGIGLCLLLGLSGAWLLATVEGPEAPAMALADGPSSLELRATAIRGTIQSLEDECRRLGGGDWDLWCASVEPYRKALRARIDSVRPHHTSQTEAPDQHWYALCTERGEPPLLELAPTQYLHYLIAPESVESFRLTLPVAVVSRWLQEKGIDLLFVPVPKMTESYPDRMAEPSPAGRVAAPHIRRLLAELLRQDVEVLDLLPEFLAAADRDRLPLYCPDDTHWAPRGRQIAAALIARRLQRYTFLRCLREQPPRFKVTESPWTPQADGARADARLPAEMFRRIEPALPRLLPEVKPLGKDQVLDLSSPVLFIGDSYTEGLAPLVAAQLNVPVGRASTGGQTTEAIAEAVRNPDMLRGCRIVVWVISNPGLAAGPARWALPPQVEAVRE